MAPTIVGRLVLYCDNILLYVLLLLLLCCTVAVLASSCNNTDSSNYSKHGSGAVSVPKRRTEAEVRKLEQSMKCSSYVNSQGKVLVM